MSDRGSDSENVIVSDLGSWKMWLSDSLGGDVIIVIWIFGICYVHGQRQRYSILQKKHARKPVPIFPFKLLQLTDRPVAG